MLTIHCEKGAFIFIILIENTSGSHPPIWVLPVDANEIFKFRNSRLFDINDLDNFE
jgi:hypothetical protein